MDRREKGTAFIINNYNFKTLSPRTGSDVDVENVKHVFKEIGYKVIAAQDLTAEGIRDEVTSLKDKILKSDTPVMSFVLVLMSHGDTEGVIYGTDEQPVKVKEITDVFSGRKCPKLNGKPKMFFFQACRGDQKMQSAYDVIDGAYAGGRSSKIPQPVEFEGNPDKADTFIALSTCEDD
ncbi:caspase-3-like [Diadema antillarum]|uniref:caspase-3-like n=1 Tax=Diadema antillarum TaxID=105358 RepID=UPI003A85F1EA